jgi:hypothetical protein
MSDDERAESRAGARVDYADDIRRPNEPPELDDVFISDVKHVHVELMDDGAWWMRIERTCGDALVINLWTRCNARILARAEWD